MLRRSQTDVDQDDDGRASDFSRRASSAPPAPLDAACNPCVRGVFGSRRWPCFSGSITGCKPQSRSATGRDPSRRRANVCRRIGCLLPPGVGRSRFDAALGSSVCGRREHAEVLGAASAWLRSDGRPTPAAGRGMASRRSRRVPNGQRRIPRQGRSGHRRRRRGALPIRYADGIEAACRISQKCANACESFPRPRCSKSRPAIRLRRPTASISFSQPPKCSTASRRSFPR